MCIRDRTVDDPLIPVLIPLTPSTDPDTGDAIYPSIYTWIFGEPIIGDFTPEFA